MLDWTREQLAASSGVSKMTLADFETGKRQPYARTLADIVQALEDAGLVFIPENGSGPGLKFRERQSAAVAVSDD